MPKNGNVKKNVSKQVKKNKQQKGSGPMIDMMREGLSGMLMRRGGGADEAYGTTTSVEIDFTKKFNELMKYSDNWKTTQDLKDIKGELKDNEYYIDTFLSKQILEVLRLSHDNNYKSIKYVKYSHVEIVPEEVHYLVSKDKGKKIIQQNIKDIDISDLNTFAIIEFTITNHGLKDESSVTEIGFPTKLIFEVTHEEGGRDVVNAFQKLINEEIARRISLAIEKLGDEIELSKMKAQANDKWIADQAMIVKEKEREKEELITYLRHKVEGVSLKDWGYMVRTHVEIMRNIVKKFKEKEHNDRRWDAGGKKSKNIPKKEILGKMICIYKIPGERKEYVRHKGKLITVKDYKELMKAKKSQLN